MIRSAPAADGPRFPIHFSTPQTTHIRVDLKSL